MAPLLELTSSRDTIVRGRATPASFGTPANRKESMNQDRQMFLAIPLLFVLGLLCLAEIAGVVAYFAQGALR